jgi:uncharacterized protein YjbJ (UPF0337 family)
MTVVHEVPAAAARRIAKASMTGLHDTAKPPGDTPNGGRRRLHPQHSTAPRTSGRIAEMDDQHAKGTVSKIEGKVEEVAGKVTGDKSQELHGKAKQIQGSGQQALGDVQDAIRKSDDKPTQA